MKDFSVKVIRGILVLLSKLPLRFHYFMGDILSWVAKNVVGYRKYVVLVNLSRSFPKEKYQYIRRVYNEFYKHFGEIVAEAIWFSGSNYKKLVKSEIVVVTNPEVLSAAYEASPSVTMLSTHCGNWELLGGIVGYKTADGNKIRIKESSVNVVYKKLSNDLSDKVFVLNRTAPLPEGGLECPVESNDILRYALRHRNEKRLYIYPADQAPYNYAGRHLVGNFMNQQTLAMIGSIGLACKLSHAVMYMKMKRVKRGRYEMTFIPICDDASKMSQEAIIRKYYDLLEEEIRETPCNWLWTHNRWKFDWIEQ